MTSLSNKFLNDVHDSLVAEGKDPSSFTYDNLLDTMALSERVHPEPQYLQMVETQPDTPTVDRLLARFNKQWEETAIQCLIRAQELEDAAADLRERARNLQEAASLTAEVKGAVQYEINARNRAASLALVKVNGG